MLNTGLTVAFSPQTQPRSATETPCLQEAEGKGGEGAQDVWIVGAEP